MPFDLTQSANYANNMAEYQRRRAAASEEGDQTKLSEAEQWWATKRAEMVEEVAERQQRDGAISAALARAKSEFPLAPEAVYSNLGDPQLILSAAQSAHAAIQAAQAPTQPDAPSAPKPSTSWGGGVPAGQTTSELDLNDPAQRGRRMLDLRDKVMAGDRQALKEFQDLSIKPFLDAQRQVLERR